MYCKTKNSYFEKKNYQGTAYIIYIATNYATLYTICPL